MTRHLHLARCSFEGPVPPPMALDQSKATFFSCDTAGISTCNRVANTGLKDPTNRRLVQLGVEKRPLNCSEELGFKWCWCCPPFPKRSQQCFHERAQFRVRGFVAFRDKIRDSGFRDSGLLDSGLGIWDSVPNPKSPIPSPRIQSRPHAESQSEDGPSQIPTPKFRILPVTNPEFHSECGAFPAPNTEPRRLNPEPGIPNTNPKSAQPSTNPKPTLCPKSTLSQP